MKSGYFFILPFMITLFSASAQAPASAAEVKFFCTSWGRTGSWDSFCARVKQAGYDGVETTLPRDEAEQKEMFGAFEKHGLEYILMHIVPGDDFSAYREAYRQHLPKLIAYKPVLINCHTGKDHFSFEQNKELIDLATEMGKKSGIPIAHETHRGRFSFAAHITREYLAKIPELKLTLDISHWCNVHESMLNDQPEAVSAAISRTAHIHARVGFPEGPQVNDPRAPEWKNALEQHLKWWDRAIEQQGQQGKKVVTITSEFGPPDYLPTLPYTRQPVSVQWDINEFIMNLLKERYRK